MNIPEEVAGGSVVHWVVALVLSVVVAAAGIAVSDSRELIKGTHDKVDIVVKEAAENKERIAVLESQYTEILRRLNDIDGNLRTLTNESTRNSSAAPSSRGQR